MKTQIDLLAFEQMARDTYPAKNQFAPTASQTVLWNQQATTLNSQLALKDPASSKFQIITHPTGTGKSHALAVYAARFITETKGHMIIAVREIVEADALAERINRHAGRHVAAAHHSKHIVRTDERCDFNVLIVTHAGIAKALEQGEQRKDSRDSYLHSHGDLIVFDEAPDALFKVTEVPLTTIRHLKAFSSCLDMKEHEEAIQFLGQLLNTAENRRSCEDKFVWTSSDDCPISPLSTLAIDRIFEAFVQETEKPNALFSKNLGEVDAKALAGLPQTWVMLRNHKGHLVFETAKFIWPEHVKKPVVLDATGELWQIWQHMESQVNFVKPAVQARRYDQLTLHVRREGNLGKTCDKKKHEDRARRVCFDRSTSDHPTLVVTHKDRLKPTMENLSKLKGANYANWFGLDGKNDWADCPRIVFLSLPYDPPHLASLKASAVMTPSSNSGRQPDDLEQYTLNEMTGKMIQAINRIKCRTIIDEKGNCAKTDAYLFVPPGPQGDELLRIIQEHLPGARIKDWPLSSPKTPGGKRSRAHLAFLTQVLALPPGTYTTREIADGLGWTTDQFKKLPQALGDAKHWLSAELEKLGFSVRHQGKGRGSVWYLEKPQ